MPRAAIIFHDPPLSDRAAGLFPLVRELGAVSIVYRSCWRGLQERSWTLGRALRIAGMTYYGSEWNYLLPVVDDLRLARAFRKTGADVAHFLWGEFASPRSRGLYGRRKALVGTFHASARKLPHVLRRPRAALVYDRITLMSETQKPFFLEAGVPEDRMSVILHGVDTAVFSPGQSPVSATGPLRALIAGSTERDHEFLARVARRMKPDELRLTAIAPAEQLAAYRDIPSARPLSQVPFADLLRLYQESDLLLMPLMDATANNAILEAMACGTPVMTNRVGGIPEYVDPHCNVVTDGKDEDEWVRRLKAFASDRSDLSRLRLSVRRWAERFDWRLKAEEYRKVYAEAVGDSGG